MHVDITVYHPRRMRAVSPFRRAPCIQRGHDFSGSPGIRFHERPYQHPHSRAADCHAQSRRGARLSAQQPPYPHPYAYNRQKCQQPPEKPHHDKAYSRLAQGIFLIFAPCIFHSIHSPFLIAS